MISTKEISTKPVQLFQVLRDLFCFFFSKMSPSGLYFKESIDSQPRLFDTTVRCNSIILQYYWCEYNLSYRDSYHCYSSNYLGCQKTFIGHLISSIHCAKKCTWLIFLAFEKTHWRNDSYYPFEDRERPKTFSGLLTVTQLVVGRVHSCPDSLCFPLAVSTLAVAIAS